MKFLITCPFCERDYRSECDDDTGLATEPCSTCGRLSEDYWAPDE